MLRFIAQGMYALNGAGFLLAAATVLAAHSGLLPRPWEEFVREASHDDRGTLHIMQEFSSLLVFAGLISFWFMGRYEQSRPFHWAMTVFWGLIAWIHWADVRGTPEALIGPLVNAVPFVLFLVVGLLRQRLDAKAKTA